MMGHINRFILFVTIFFVLPGSAYALELTDQSINVWKFQQKLAMNGNVSAQYKLAFMYESGTGVELNIEQAKSWYERASTAGSKVAKDRMTYLSIKEKGYDQAKDLAWLNGIKKDAKVSNGDEMFLLAQLYRQGLGVKKDLNKAFEILDQVSLLGAADVENEIELIQAEMERQRLEQRQEENIAQLAEKEKQQKQADAKRKKEKKAEAEKVAQLEKRRKYEEIMLKIKLEQQQIDEQQVWASGVISTEIDSEI